MYYFFHIAIACSYSTFVDFVHHLYLYFPLLVVFASIIEFQVDTIGFSPDESNAKILSMFDKIKMRRGRQWYVNKGNEWFFDEKHDKMNGKIEQI